MSGDSCDSSVGEDTEDGEGKVSGLDHSNGGEAIVSNGEGKGEEVRGEVDESKGVLGFSRVSYRWGEEESGSDSILSNIEREGEDTLVIAKEMSNSKDTEAGFQMDRSCNLSQPIRNPFISDAKKFIDIPEAMRSNCGRPFGVCAGRPTKKDGVQQRGENFSGFKGVDFSSCTTLFVKNIPPSVAAYKLKAWFFNFGKVIDVFIPKKRCKVSGLSFAFVRFRRLEEAILACERADGSIFDGFVLDVNISKYPRLVSEHRTVNGAHHDAGGFDGRLAGRVPIQGPFSFGLQGAALSDGGGYRHEKSRPRAGASYAQILLKGANVKSGSTSVACMSDPLVENSDHLQAIITDISGRDCLDSRISHVSCIDDCMISELCFHNSGSACPAVDGDSLVEVLGASGEVADNGSDLLIPSDRKSNDPSYHETEAADTHSVYALLRSSSEVAYDSQVQENREEAGEEEPLTKEEKAEIRAQVRYIVHDALQIGKGMGINITPRDERMIKRFAVLRQFDKAKWRMKFDDEIAQD